MHTSPRRRASGAGRAGRVTFRGAAAKQGAAALPLPENRPRETMSEALRRRLLASLAFGWIALALPAAAAERAAFTEAAFEAARAANRPLIVEVTAPWCPTCRAQRPHVDAALADPDMAGALLLTVDFDSQKEALRRLGVRSQSTLIAFRGAEERARATGITDPAQIQALIRRAL